MSYADLEPGDYVVHDIHGIGRYLGLESITHDGVTAEYVKISYDENALLYIPTDKLDLLSKYIGARAEDGSVRLSRLGGKDWEKAKSRAKKATNEMARELIQLYAERQRRPGFAFPPDDEMQRQFESAFEYEETDGQNSAVEEIKRDMEAPWPMERLLCGDVGFGKTEVALRAAFKAVAAGRTGGDSRSDNNSCDAALSDDFITDERISRAGRYAFALPNQGGAGGNPAEASPGRA